MRNNLQIENKISGVLVDNNKSLSYALNNSGFPLFQGSTTEKERIENPTYNSVDIQNNIEAITKASETYSPDTKVSTLYNPLPIIDGHVLEFSENNPYVKALYRTNGKVFINMHDNNVKLNFKKKNNLFKPSIKSTSNLEFKFTKIEDFFSNNEHIFRKHVEKYMDYYKQPKEVGLFAITKNNDLWVCYRKSAQGEIADVDNWLLSLLYHYYCWTDDQDLIKSITHSGGTAGQELPKSINYQLT